MRAGRQAADGAAVLFVLMAQSDARIVAPVRAAQNVNWHAIHQANWAKDAFAVRGSRRLRESKAGGSFLLALAAP